MLCLRCFQTELSGCLRPCETNQWNCFLAQLCNVFQMCALQMLLHCEKTQGKQGPFEACLYSSPCRYSCMQDLCDIFKCVHRKCSFTVEIHRVSKGSLKYACIADDSYADSTTCAYDIASHWQLENHISACQTKFLSG